MHILHAAVLRFSDMFSINEELYSKLFGLVDKIFCFNSIHNLAYFSNTTEEYMFSATGICPIYPAAIVSLGDISLMQYAANLEFNSARWAYLFPFIIRIPGPDAMNI